MQDMSIQVQSAVVKSGKLVPVTVEISKSSKALPRIVMVGLAGKAVMESKERVLSALKASQVSWKPAKYTINFLPVDVSKEGSSLDAAIAICFLQINQEIPTGKHVALAEIKLDGSWRNVAHQLALTDYLTKKHQTVFVPWLAQNILGILPAEQRKRIILVKDLTHFIALAKGWEKIKHPDAQVLPANFCKDEPPQELSLSALRVLVTAIAGGHHTLLFGSPGVGKSYLKEAIKYLIPPLDDERRRQLLIEHSLFNRQRAENQLYQRFIAPSAQVTRAQLIGGHRPFQPGLICSLKRGILFLDELPHYSLATLEALQEPIENQQIKEHLFPENQIMSWPCSFTCIATANPCPCGYFGLARCKCNLQDVYRYVRKISGALLDRFAIIWRVDDQDSQAISTKEWQQWRQKVVQARQRQDKRAQKNDWPQLNQSYQVEQFEQLIPSQYLKKSRVDKLHWRQWLHNWRIALTLSDLEQCEPNWSHYQRAQLLSNRADWPG